MTSTKHQARFRAPCSTLTLLVVVLVGLLFCPGARADDNHYQNYLVGERAVGFGGAFTAIADDSSAVFYNPAGLTQLQKSSISLSAAIYGFSNQSASLVATGDGGERSTLDDNASSTFITYPTTAVWIQKLRDGDKDGSGRMLAAFSLLTPFSKVGRSRSAYETAPQGVNGGGGTYTERGVELQLSEDDTLWIGLSFAWRPLRWLHIGATTFFTMRSGLYQFYDSGIYTVRNNDGDPVLIEGRTTRVAADLKHFGLVGLLGVLVEPLEHLRVGLTFRSPQLSLGSKLEVSVIQAERQDLSQPVDVLQGEVGGDFNDVKPWKASLGLAYARPKHFAVSADISFYGPASSYHVMELDGNADLFPLEHRLLWQLNIGGEYYVLPSLSLRAGFFTNLSSFEAPQTCTDQACRDRLSNPFGDPIDRFGIAGSASYELDRATVTVAFSYNFGSTRRGYSANLDAEGERSLLFLVLGGSFRF